MLYSIFCRSTAAVEASSAALPDFDRIATALATTGYFVGPGFFPLDHALALAAETQAHWRAGAFRPAGVGRGAGWGTRPEIRSDEVCWLEEEAPSPALQAALTQLSALQAHLNRSLFAGLEEFEVHLARYGRGAFYARHIDQFEDTTRRAISVVLYLNHHWRRQDGGALRLWTTPAPGREPPSSRTPYLEVLPEAGTLVVFRSADFWHEVRRARRPRLSLTGWFLRRPANPLEQLA
jgi:SM-20-related protein